MLMIVPLAMLLGLAVMAADAAWRHHTGLVIEKSLSSYEEDTPVTSASWPEQLAA
jgi:hypothetical protein